MPASEKEVDVGAKAHRLQAQRISKTSAGYFVQEEKTAFATRLCHALGRSLHLILNYSQEISGAYHHADIGLGLLVNSAVQYDVHELVKAAQDAGDLSIPVENHCISSALVRYLHDKPQLELQPPGAA